MAVTTNVAGFVRRTQKMAASIPVAERAGIEAAAKVAKTSILAAARARGGRPTDNWVKIVPHAGTTPQALVELRGGPAYWKERGTKAHRIAPKTKRAVMTPAGPRASAKVRGRTARPFWHLGVEASRVPATKAHAEAVGAVIRQGFGG
jgi:hypothetical protein